MSASFHKARLKVRRANDHIKVITEQSAKLPAHLYEIVNGPARSFVVLATPNCHSLVYRPREPVSEHFEPIIGDAVNNLREAMDLWINAVHRIRTGKDNLYFPFAEEWKNLAASKNFGPVHKAFPELADFILNEVKPCKDTNLLLWAATDTSCFNKHKGFLPSVNIARATFSAMVGNSMFQDCSAGGNADGQVGIIRAPVPITLTSGAVGVSVGVTFGVGTVFEKRAVIPTLMQMSQTVSDTLDALDRFVTPFLPRR
jgi:hypothetical protein